MGGKLHKVDRIRIRHRTRLSKSISMQDQSWLKTEKNSLREKIIAREKTRRWKVRIVPYFQVTFPQARTCVKKFIKVNKKQSSPLVKKNNWLESALKIDKRRFFLYIWKKSYIDFSRAPIKIKEAYVTIKAPSQGKIEQKFPFFPITKGTTLPVWHERTYEIKVNFPSDKINLSFFPFFPRTSAVTVNDRFGAATRIKVATE